MHKNMKCTTIFAINPTVCTSIKAANLVLCGTILLGSLMMIFCGSKHIGIFGVILFKFLRNNTVHFWVQYCELITETVLNEQRKMSVNLL